MSWPAAIHSNERLRFRAVALQDFTYWWAWLKIRVHRNPRKYKLKIRLLRFEKWLKKDIGFSIPELTHPDKSFNGEISHKREISNRY